MDYSGKTLDRTTAKKLYAELREGAPAFVIASEQGLIFTRGTTNHDLVPEGIRPGKWHKDEDHEKDIELKWFCLQRRRWLSDSKGCLYWI